MFNPFKRNRKKLNDLTLINLSSLKKREYKMVLNIWRNKFTKIFESQLLNLIILFCDIPNITLKILSITNVISNKVSISYKINNINFNINQLFIDIKVIDNKNEIIINKTYFALNKSYKIEDNIYKLDIIIENDLLTEKSKLNYKVSLCYYSEVTLEQSVINFQSSISQETREKLSQFSSDINSPTANFYNGINITKFKKLEYKMVLNIWCNKYKIKRITDFPLYLLKIIGFYFYVPNIQFTIFRIPTKMHKYQTNVSIISFNCKILGHSKFNINEFLIYIKLINNKNKLINKYSLNELFDTKNNKYKLNISHISQLFNNTSQIDYKFKVSYYNESTQWFDYHMHPRKIQYRVKNELFTVFDYYQPTGRIYGCWPIVCEAIDTRNGRKVAIQKHKGAFDDLTSARRILREIKLLMFLNHEDILQLIDVVPPDSGEEDTFNDIYLVFFKMETNLAKVIRSKQKLSNRHYQFFIYQILRGLKYIHSAGVIHKDLKPENILINGSDCNVKITDFGLARGVYKDEIEKPTEYVVTRWYRAPEVMCSAGYYNEKIDIWSVGCIMAELIIRKPLFPGQNYLDQLKIIFEIMGTPKDLKWIKTKEAKIWVSKLKAHSGKNLNKIFDKVSNEARELLYLMLKMNPEQRISAKKGLEHEWLNELHDESEEPICKNKFDLSYEFEKSIKTKFGVRHLMYKALKEYKQYECQTKRYKNNKKRKRKRKKHQNSKNKRKD